MIPVEISSDRNAIGSPENQRKLFGFETAFPVRFGWNSALLVRIQCLAGSLRDNVFLHKTCMILNDLYSEHTSTKIPPVSVTCWKSKSSRDPVQIRARSGERFLPGRDKHGAVFAQLGSHRECLRKVHGEWGSSPDKISSSGEMTKLLEGARCMSYPAGWARSSFYQGRMPAGTNDWVTAKGCKNLSCSYGALKWD